MPFAGAAKTGAGGAAGVGVGVGLRRPPLAYVGSIQIKSNVAVNTEQIFFSNIAFTQPSAGVGREATKEADGKTIRERLPGCYYSMVNLQGTREVEAIDPQGRAGFITLWLLDFIPEPAAILNIWENKLALVKGERTGSVVAPE